MSQEGKLLIMRKCGCFWVANFLAFWVWGRYFGIDIPIDMSKILVELNCLLTLINMNISDKLCKKVNEQLRYESRR